MHLRTSRWFEFPLSGGTQTSLFTGTSVSTETPGRQIGGYLTATSEIKYIRLAATKTAMSGW